MNHEPRRTRNGPIHRNRQSHRRAEEVWHYVADLRSVAEWDPSVDRIVLIDGEPRTLSARYELEVSFRGKSLALPYRTVEVDPPHRVVFTAGTDSVSVRDEARIEPAGPEGSRVIWDAELRLRGFRRLLEPLLRPAFNRIGKAAENGLAERLRKPVLEARPDRVRT